MPSHDQWSDSCTGVSGRLGEPLPGSARHVAGWVLLEHAGPWDGDAPGSLLDPALAAELRLRCDEVGIGLAAVRRRPGRRHGDPRSCVVVSSGPDATWARRCALADAKGLLDLDLAGIADGRPPLGSDPVAAPRYLVCAHGRRDVCCGRLGRPVRDALAAAGADVWEATHVGGHRFAANVLVLPHGLLYGRVDPTSAGRIVDATARGEVVRELLRGRSALPQAAQAADWFTRRATGHNGIDDVRVATLTHEADTWTARVETPTVTVEVRVAQRAGGCTAPTTCGADLAPRRWVLRGVTTVAVADRLASA